MHPRLTRLDTLAAALASDGGVVAVLGLGSSGAQYRRFDDYSDIDFFVITSDVAAKGRHLADIDWLAPMGSVTYSFAHDANGRKALFSDGLFVEYAIFTVAQLSDIPFTDARVIWRQPGVVADLEPSQTPPVVHDDTVEFHLNEALTNLLVGVQRELRGERLSAYRFIQVYAVDHVLAIARTIEPARSQAADPFDPTRRAEDSCPCLRAELPRMIPGYADNLTAAGAVLDWLTRHGRPHPAIAGRIASAVAGRG